MRSRFEVEQALRRELDPGERLLWSGQPVQGLRLQAGDLFLVPFSLMWGGFAIVWEWLAIRSGAPWFFKLWGIPFVLIGLHLMVGRFFADARLRGRTLYGLTDRRVLIVRTGRRPALQGLHLEVLPEVSLQEGRGGIGTVSFGGVPPQTVRALGTTWRTTPGVPAAFTLVPNARAVYDQVRAARDAAAPPAR